MVCWGSALSVPRATAPQKRRDTHTHTYGVRIFARLVSDRLSRALKSTKPQATTSKPADKRKYVPTWRCRRSSGARPRSTARRCRCSDMWWCEVACSPLDLCGQASVSTSRAPNEPRARERGRGWEKRASNGTSRVPQDDVDQLVVDLLDHRQRVEHWRQQTMSNTHQPSAIRDPTILSLAHSMIVRTGRRVLIEKRVECVRHQERGLACSHTKPITAHQTRVRRSRSVGKATNSIRSRRARSMTTTNETGSRARSRARERSVSVPTVPSPTTPSLMALVILPGSRLTVRAGISSVGGEPLEVEVLVLVLAML